MRLETSPRYKLKMYQYFLFTLLPLAFAQIDGFEKCDRTVDLAIVGAGPSGAYFSYLYRKSGLYVEMVEFTDRVGGRHRTYRMDNAPNIPIELGPCMYTDSHSRMKRIVKELELTEEEFPKAWVTPGDTRYFIKGQSIKEQDILNGAPLPYQLTPEEVKNQGRLPRYYLEKLTNYTGDELPREIRLHLRVLKRDQMGNINVPLYKYTLSDALDLVASPDGKELFYTLIKQKAATYKDVNALLAFSNYFNFESRNVVMRRVKEGMEAVPKKMIDKFLDEDKNRHRLSFNRKLVSIERRGWWHYTLKLAMTTTENGFTYETGLYEHLCADKVVLALPTTALKLIQWKPLKSGLVAEVLDSVRTVPVSKIVMTFNRPHWLENPDRKATMAFTDETISKVFELGNTTDTYILMASFAEGERVRDLENLNLDGPVASQPSIPEEFKVSQHLNQHIITKLNTIFGTTFQTPLNAMGVFWTKFPQIGGETIWRANRHYDLVKNVIEHPSLDDDVFVVGSDYAWGNTQAWTEGSLETVETVVIKYFQ